MTNDLPRRRGPVLRWTTVLTGLVLALSLGSTAAQAAITDPPTVVSLTFDDSTVDQMVAADIMNEHQMKGTFYTVSGLIGATGSFTRAQLDTLYTSGHEIGGHTVTHADLTAANIDEATRQVCNDRATLLGWGYPVTSFAYPFASATPDTEALVRNCGYNSARGLGDIETRFSCPGCGFAEAFAPADPYYTKAPDQFDATWTLADLQNTVVNAEESGGGWVQLTFHRVCDNACDSLAISSTLFREFTAWLALRAATENTVVKTVGAVIGGAVQPAVSVENTTPPAPGPGVNGLNNPGLESAGVTAAPQCWTAYTYGTNTPTFTTVTPGRTGVSAEQVSVAAYTDGDARIMPTLDLGQCAPSVTPDHTYSLRAWYTSTTPTQFALYLRSGIGSWVYWTSSPWFPASAGYTQAVWTTPVIPAGSTGLSFGLNLFQNGQLVTDDYELYDSVGAPAPVGVPVGTSATTTRVSGVDRFGTATQVSQAYAPGVARVYVANAFGFPDALSASPAAAHFASPVLLTAQDALTPGVREEIRRLAPAQIVIAGGTAAVSDAVLADLQAINPATTVVRIGGVDRYETSRLIAQNAFGSAATVYLATGSNFPDALSASPAAAHFAGPIILVPGEANGIDAATTTLLGTLGTTTVKIAGGPAVMSVAVENAVRTTPGVTTVQRHAGADRYGTAAAINLDAFATSGTVHLAAGDNFPDALVGAALAGLRNAPLYLTPATCVDRGAIDGISRLAATQVVLFGGPAVLGDSVMSLTPCA